MNIEEVEALEIEVDRTGLQGLSAYEIALENGYVGTEAQWLASLKGATGATGATGPQGVPGQNGTNGQDGYSPTANVTKVGNTATITITDKNGTTTATVSDGTGGTSDYATLTNKPKINNVELSGNKTTSDLGLFSGDYNDLSSIPESFNPNIRSLDQEQPLNEYQWFPFYDPDREYNFAKTFPELGAYIKENQGLATETYVGTQLATKQNTLTAGTNITITNDVISASGGGDKSGEGNIYIWNGGSNVSGNPNGLNITSTVGTLFQNIINDAYSKDKKVISLVATANNTSGYSGELSSYMYTGIQCNLQDEPTLIFLAGNASMSDTHALTPVQLTRKMLRIYGTWTNHIFTIQNVYHMVTIVYIPVFTNNSYTVSSSKHPATKEYVDGAITSAITTTLGGSY